MASHGVLEEKSPSLKALCGDKGPQGRQIWGPWGF